METPSEWLEVSGPSVEVAVQVALTEFGLDSPDQVSVEVIQEGKKGLDEAKKAVAHAKAGNKQKNE